MNFLQMLAQAAASPNTGGLEQDFDNSFGKPIIPQIAGPIEASRPPPNILQQLLAESPLGQQPPPDLSTIAQPVIERPHDGHGRRSVLDIIGGLSDVIAGVGGSQPMYQSRLDAATARDQAATANDWQEKFNTQKYTSGQHELQGDINTQTAQAVRGLTAIYGDGGPEGEARLAKAFPMIANQLGMDPGEANTLWSHIQADPKNALEALTGALDPTKANTSPSAPTQMYNLLKSSGHPELAEKYLDNQVNGAPLTQAQRLTIGIQAQRLGIDRQKATAYVAEHTPAAPGAGGGTGGLTGPAIDYAADLYNTTHKLPPLGQGKAAAAMRAAIVNRAEERARGSGDMHDNPGAFGADFAANASGLKTMTNRATSILASERTATANADQILRTMGKGAGSTGVPVLNAWQNRARNNLSGNPDVAAFNTAVTTFANEYAAVVSGGAGANAPTTVHAQQEATRQINNAMTPGQLKRVIGQMKIEMGNRREAFANQAGEMRARMRLPGAATTAHSNLPIMTPEQVRASPKGTKYRTADGRTGTRP